MLHSEIDKLDKYIKKLFNSQEMNIKKLANKGDSFELYKGDEFIGTIYRQEEDGELSYDINLAILDIDIE